MIPITTVRGPSIIQEFEFQILFYLPIGSFYFLGSKKADIYKYFFFFEIYRERITHECSSIIGLIERFEETFLFI